MRACSGKTPGPLRRMSEWAELPMVMVCLAKPGIIGSSPVYEAVGLARLLRVAAVSAIGRRGAPRRARLGARASWPALGAAFTMVENGLGRGGFGAFLDSRAGGGRVRRRNRLRAAAPRQARRDADQHAGGARYASLCPPGGVPGGRARRPEPVPRAGRQGDRGPGGGGTC